MSLTLDRELYSRLLIEAQPKVIETDAEYEQALNRIEDLMHRIDRTPEQTALLKLFVTLVEDFEEQDAPLPSAPPNVVLQHLMEAREMRQADLVGILGSRGVVSEIFNGKRAISKAQAKILGDLFQVSPALFI